jgi:Fe-S cluster biogenesis protein NfuA
VKKEVEEQLNEIRPALQADGGDIELVDVDEETGVVKVKLVGACAGCPMSQMTLQMGVERVLKNKIPGVTSVENVGMPAHE